FEPATPRHEFVKLAFQPRDFRAQQGIIQPQEDIAALNDIAVPDQDFADDATIGMLHDLSVAFDPELPAGNDRTRKRGCRPPAAKPPRKKHDTEDTEQDETTGAPAIPARGAVSLSGGDRELRRHGAATPPPSRWRAAPGMALHVRLAPAPARDLATPPARRWQLAPRRPPPSGGRAGARNSASGLSAPRHAGRNRPGCPCRASADNRRRQWRPAGAPW